MDVTLIRTANNSSLISNSFYESNITVTANSGASLALALSGKYGSPAGNPPSFYSFGVMKTVDDPSRFKSGRQDDARQGIEGRHGHLFIGTHRSEHPFCRQCRRNLRRVLFHRAAKTATSGFAIIWPSSRHDQSACLRRSIVRNIFQRHSRGVFTDGYPYTSYWWHYPRRFEDLQRSGQTCEWSLYVHSLLFRRTQTRCFT